MGIDWLGHFADVALPAMTGEQRGLLCEDIQTLRCQRDEARRREIAAEAAATSAGLDVELLTLAIDNQLDALNEAGGVDG